MTICTSTPLATAMLPTAAKTVALLAAREITTGKSKSGAGDLAEDPPHTGTAGEITDHCAVACAAELAHRRQVKASPPALADDSQAERRRWFREHNRRMRVLALQTMRKEGRHDRTQ